MSVSEPARMGVDDSGLNALRPPTHDELLPPTAQPALEAMEADLSKRAARCQFWLSQGRRPSAAEALLLRGIREGREGPEYGGTRGFLLALWSAAATRRRSAGWCGSSACQSLRCRRPSCRCLSAPMPRSEKCWSHAFQRALVDQANTIAMAGVDTRASARSSSCVRLEGGQPRACPRGVRPVPLQNDAICLPF